MEVNKFLRNYLVGTTKELKEDRNPVADIQYSALGIGEGILGAVIVFTVNPLLGGIVIADALVRKPTGDQCSGLVGKVKEFYQKI